MSDITKADLAGLGGDALSPAAMEAKAENIAVARVKNSPMKIFVLALMAGFFIGLGATYCILISCDPTLGFMVKKVMGGIGFCLGLLLVLVAGAELFTGNSLMTMAWFSKRITGSAMLKNWVIVWIGNFIGSLIGVALIYLACVQDANGGLAGATMVSIATGKAGLPWMGAFFKGIMCNIMVCLAVWMAYSCRTVVDKVMVILLPISFFVASGYEHCVANMFFLPMGYVAKINGYTAAGFDDSALTINGILHNISAATCGNIVGGVIFVGLVYWFAYAKKENN